jgi:hypothetical protein
MTRRAYKDYLELKVGHDAYHAGQHVATEALVSVVDLALIQFVCASAVAARLTAGAKS